MTKPEDLLAVFLQHGLPKDITIAFAQTEKGIEARSLIHEYPAFARAHTKKAATKALKKVVLKAVEYYKIASAMVIHANDEKKEENNGDNENDTSRVTASTFGR